MVYAWRPSVLQVLILLMASGSVTQCICVTGPIRVLYMGSFGRGRPFLLMRSDPLFSIVFVQASLRAGDFPLFDVPTSATSEVVSRLIRPYMPRSHLDLASRFDVAVLNNANVIAIADYAEMLARGVREASVGLFMAGGWESFGGASGFPAWLLPTGDLPGAYEMVGLLTVGRPGNELMSSLPWDSPVAL